jgi:hypothetical protein
MKKFFLFAAAAVAAMTVNAKTISFAGIIDKTDAETAVSSFESGFETQNIYAKGAANSGGTAYCAEVYQTVGVVSWDSTLLYVPGEDQVYITFKDANKDKLVAKAWADYIQPNGKAMCLVISGLNAGDKVKLNLKEALNKETLVEGATVASTMLDAVAIELTVANDADEIRVYSKSVDGKSDAKWKLVSVEVGESQGIEDVNDAVKAVKFFENGQLVIMKNGVKYNALGAQL